MPKIIKICQSSTKPFETQKWLNFLDKYCVPYHKVN